MHSRAARPTRSGVTGTSRQARTRRPSLAAMSSMRASAAARSSVVVGQVGHAHGVGTRRRQVGIQHGPEEGVGHLGEDAGAVTDQRVGAGGAAVVEVAQGVEGVDDDVVAGGAPHRRHHGHTAGVVLVLAAVQAGVGGLGGEAGDGHVASPSSGSSAAEGPGTARSGADGSGHVPEGYPPAPAVLPFEPRYPTSWDLASHRKRPDGRSRRAAPRHPGCRRQPPGCRRRALEPPGGRCTR